MIARARPAIVGGMLAICLVLAHPASNGVSATQTARSIDAAEYPTFDASVLMLVSAGLATKQAQERARNIDDPEAARLLAGAGQPAESLKHLRQFVERHPDQIARAFKGLSTTTYTMDQSQPYAAELAEIVGLAKRQLERLPREDAATTARILVSLEAGLDRGNPRRPWPDRLNEFVRAYAGTEAALLTEVDLISAGPLDRSRLDALEDFARRHPGTAAAAKALYQKASDLAYNASGLRLETRGSDPTQRFLQVVSITQELESGSYPKCEWTDRAPQLVSGFFSYQPKYSPDNTAVMLKTYEEFIRTHFVLDPRPTENGIGYVISTKMADLFALRGERIAGIERLLTDLAGEKINPGELESFRAAFYIRQLFQDSVNREEMLAKAFATLDKLQAAKVEPYSRRALASAASLHFFERDYSAARDAYQRYLTAYPQSSWAWVAALRLGQSWIAVGDLNRAAEAFERASAVSDLPVARVLAHAYAAEVFAGLDRVDVALRHARQALAEWDDDFGVQYRFQAQQRRLPGDEPFAIPDDMTIAKETLPARIAQLERSAGQRAGGLVEQGRWLIGKGRFDDAGKTIDRAITSARGTPLEAEARVLGHRVALERALILADLQSPRADERAALQELDRLAAEPLDFAVFAARLAAATIVSRRDASTADVRITSALNDWLAGQPKGTPPPVGTFEEDVAAIRAEIFRPKGGGIYASAQRGWNAFDWPQVLPPFMLVSPDITVRLAAKDVRLVTLRTPIPGLSNVIFTDRAELDVLKTVMKRVGGTARRQPAAIMETPNQPAGAAVDVRAFWNRFFPTRQGHWSGWVFETYPIITDVTFQDAARTRAAVRVQVGYSGCTVVLVKESGKWIARELTNFWIT